MTNDTNYQRAIKLFSERGEYCVQSDAHAMVQSQYVWDCGDIFRITRDLTDRGVVSYAIAPDAWDQAADDDIEDLLSWDNRTCEPPSWLEWEQLAAPICAAQI